MAKPKKKKFKLNGDQGWHLAPHIGVKLVDELVAVNIQFKYTVVYNPGKAHEEYVEIDEHIASHIKLYMDNAGFAGMTLAEFLKKSGVIK